MVSHPELGSDPPIRSDRESGCDMVFTNEAKKQGSSATFEGGHSFNDLSESVYGHFSFGQGSI